MTTHPDRSWRLPAAALFAAVLVAAVLWSYWTTLAGVVWRWAKDPQYSHGWLVPLFAGYLLWTRRDKIARQSLYVNILGLVVIVAALGLRLAGTHYHFDYFDQISLLPCLAGIVLLVGSWPALFWSLPALAFLAFMIPL